MPRVRLFNTTFHLRKTNAKLCRIIFISSVFIMLKCLENCGLRHPPKRVPWARCQKIFKFTLYIQLFSRNQTKKITVVPKTYTAMLLYLFFDSLLLTCQKKWKLKNGPRLPTLPYIFLFILPYNMPFIISFFEWYFYPIPVLLSNIMNNKNMN